MRNKEERDLCLYSVGGHTCSLYMVEFEKTCAVILQTRIGPSDTLISNFVVCQGGGCNGGYHSNSEIEKMVVLVQFLLCSYAKQILIVNVVFYLKLLFFAV